LFGKIFPFFLNPRARCAQRLHWMDFVLPEKGALHAIPIRWICSGKKERVHCMQGSMGGLVVPERQKKKRHVA
jgi:hypothetical protein